MELECGAHGPRGMDEDPQQLRRLALKSESKRGKSSNNGESPADALTTTPAMQWRAKQRTLCSSQQRRGLECRRWQPRTERHRSRDGKTETRICRSDSPYGRSEEGGRGSAGNCTSMDRAENAGRVVSPCWPPSLQCTETRERGLGEPNRGSCGCQRWRGPLASSMREGAVENSQLHLDCALAHSHCLCPFLSSRLLSSRLSLSPALRDLQYPVSSQQWRYLHTSDTLKHPCTPAPSPRCTCTCTCTPSSPSRKVM